jgi:hypothetical protein
VRHQLLVRLSTPGAAQPVSFRWKAHPVELRSTVTATDRPHSFTFIADAIGLHAERTFTIRPTPDSLSSVVISHETQGGPFPWLGRLYLAPRLRAANQVMFEDLARAAVHNAESQVTSSQSVSPQGARNYGGSNRTESRTDAAAR